MAEKHAVIDDDIVLSHGESLLHPPPRQHPLEHFAKQHWGILLALLVAIAVVFRRKAVRNLCKRSKYSRLDAHATTISV